MITTRQAIAAIVLPASLLLANPIHAQNDDATISDEAIEAAIRAFNERNSDSASSDVVIVLDPLENEEDTADDPSAVAEGDGPPENTDNQSDKTQSEDIASSDNPTDGNGNHTPDIDSDGDASDPVLVTGKKPTDSDVIDISDIPIAPEEFNDLPLLEPEPRPGLEVRVKNIQSGSTDFDTSKVRLLAPFPAKPLIPPPAGWRLEKNKEAPPFKREVQLAPGRSINLTIHPHLLVPDADGSTLFAIQEPGFQASLGYQQSDTVAGVLSQSIEKLDADSKHLGNVIEQLQQLIVSLPKPEPPAPAAADSKTP